MSDDIIRAANQLAVQHLIRSYLCPEPEAVCTVEGACITSRQSWNRYGVPADATCWRVIIEHPEQGWSVAVRTVFRDGRLMEPAATHTVIESYCANDESLIPNAKAACVAANDWLRSL